MLTRKKEGNLQMEDNIFFLHPINPAHQYPVALETEHKKVTALIPLIWLNLRFDKIPSSKLISMVLENKN